MAILFVNICSTPNCVSVVHTPFTSNSTLFIQILFLFSNSIPTPKQMLVPRKIEMRAMLTLSIILLGWSKCPPNHDKRLTRDACLLDILHQRGKRRTDDFLVRPCGTIYDDSRRFRYISACEQLFNDLSHPRDAQEDT